MKGSPEASVVWSLKKHLTSAGLHGVLPRHVLVDADPSFLRSSHRTQLEPMAQIPIEGARPDLLCSTELSRGILVTGFEVKASARDAVAGLAQARRYRAGVHQSYLAVPGDPIAIERQTATVARDFGVGIFVLEHDTWVEVLEPTRPSPQPTILGDVTSILGGAPLVRRLQLNHPLNYLAVASIAAESDAARLLPDIERRWSDLTTKSSRMMAVNGAQSLGLLDTQMQITAEGAVVADLLRALGFDPATRISKTQRLAEFQPGLAAVARFVFLRQPGVQLIQQSLSRTGDAISAVDLARLACRLDPALGGALFFREACEPTDLLVGLAYATSTPFQLKQCLWHCGLLATKAHASSGKGGTAYRPDLDLWSLEVR